MVRSRLTTTSASQVQVILPCSSFLSPILTVTLWSCLITSQGSSAVEMRFHYVGQAGLELLTS
ncbi:hypothetical protein AAY473_025667 [Plecturocebus cupreus]